MGQCPHPWIISFTTAFVILVSVCDTGYAFRVALIPLPATSHCREMVSIGRALQARGHRVILYVPSYFKVRRCTEPHPSDSSDVEVRIFGQTEATSNLMEDFMKGNTGHWSSSTLRAALQYVCKSYLDAKVDLDKLVRAKLDLVLIDGTPSGHCLTLVPAYLGVPFGAVGGFISPFDSGMPIPFTYYPFPVSSLPGSMGFLQRLKNFLHYTLLVILDGYVTPVFSPDILNGRLREVDQKTLIKKAVLFLENSDHIVDYPKATLPNFIQVGGLTTSPAQPLPGLLKKFFDGAGEKGVVVVSLGSLLDVANKVLEERVVSAFNRLDARVLLSFNTTANVSKSSNIQVVSWFPQNNALGHPNTRLFVSHCGRNGFYEAVYHGVPMLCTPPFNEESLGTASRVHEFGVGRWLDLKTATSDQISSILMAMLKDKSLFKRIKNASTLFKSREISPADKAARAVENVIKYGSAHMRSRSVDLNFFQFSGLDVAFTLFLIPMFMTSAAAVFTWIILVYIRRREEMMKDDDSRQKAVIFLLLSVVVIFYTFF